MKSLDIYKWRNLPPDITIPPIRLWEQILQQSVPYQQGFRPHNPIYYGVVDYGEAQSIKTHDRLRIDEAKIVELSHHADLANPNTDVIVSVGVLRYSGSDPPTATHFGRKAGVFVFPIDQKPLFGIQVYMWEDKFWLDAVDAYDKPYVYRIITTRSPDGPVKKKLSVIYPIGATNG